MRSGQVVIQQDVCPSQTSCLGVGVAVGVGRWVWYVAVKVWVWCGCPALGREWSIIEVPSPDKGQLQQVRALIFIRGVHDSFTSSKYWLESSVVEKIRKSAAVTGAAAEPPAATYIAGPARVWGSGGS